MNRIEINDQSNLVIEESIIGELHETNESVGFGTMWWNPAAYVAGGNPLNPLPRQGSQFYPEITNGWDTVKGSADEEAALILGDTPLPVYYNTGQQMGVILDNVHDSRVVVEGTYLSRALYIKNCSGLEVTVKSRACKNAINMINSTEIEIHSSDMLCSTAPHIHAVDCKNLHIHDNHGSHGCLSESVGGIYLSESSGLVVEFNTIAFNNYGTYWKWDGGCIYFEHGTTDSIARKNTVVGSYLGLQDNSGGNNLWEGNRVVGCEYAMDITNGSPEYYGNILIDTQDAGPRTQSNGRQVIIQ